MRNITHPSISFIYLLVTVILSAHLLFYIVICYTKQHGKLLNKMPMFVACSTTYFIDNMGLRHRSAMFPHWSKTSKSLMPHYRDVIMSLVASQITSLTIVYSSVYSGGTENIKALRHWPLCGNSPVTREFPAQRASNAENISIDDVIMDCLMVCRSIAEGLPPWAAVETYFFKSWLGVVSCPFHPRFIYHIYPSNNLAMQKPHRIVLQRKIWRQIQMKSWVAYLSP